ncbi:MAG: nucleoside deaminase [Actinopolymorphaceae bacterium]
MTSTDHRAAPDDAALLRQAVRLALQNAETGQPPFGALVVRDGEVLATGVNTTALDNDPTAHAEVAAVRAACRKLASPGLLGATVVSSCEPCAMCHATCAVAGIARIVYAAPKEFVPGIERTPPLLAEMQAALGRLGTDALHYIPTAGAEEPFTRFVEISESRR